MWDLASCEDGKFSLSVMRRRTTSLVNLLPGKSAEDQDQPESLCHCCIVDVGVTATQTQRMIAAAAADTLEHQERRSKVEGRRSR